MLVLNVLFGGLKASAVRTGNLRALQYFADFDNNKLKIFTGN
jgi:hypothetical protein